MCPSEVRAGQQVHFQVFQHHEKTSRFSQLTLHQHKESTRSRCLQGFMSVMCWIFIQCRDLERSLHPHMYTLCCVKSKSNTVCQLRLESFTCFSFWDHLQQDTELDGWTDINPFTLTLFWPGFCFYLPHKFYFTMPIYGIFLQYNLT